MPTDKVMVAALRSAVTYALEVADDGLEWLRAWNEGDPAAMAELDTWRN